MSLNMILLAVLAVFAGALMRSMFGFGEAIVSMPLLAILQIPLHTSVSLIGMAGLTVAALTVFSGWKHIERGVLIRLAISTLVGIPVGIFIIQVVPGPVITVGLGLFLIAYGIYSLLKKKWFQKLDRPLLGRGGWIWPFGFASGVLGSAYNFNGVPVVVYGTLRKWSPERLRGTLQAHFLISGVLVVSGHALGGLWTMDSLILYGYSIPAILLATVLGVFLNKRIPAKRFEQYLFLIIILLGVLLVFPHS
ncbi:sulfite exporter TauE/SafE family protein [Bacillus sp. 1P06AnD]|uniref:sulfite exporter TauE/SafE family protein n=1 Tax=Bacillus sp. 1P06AnD TaxID=3132208 RepID=UPI00399F65B4